jgi:hypothetical protein
VPKIGRPLAALGAPEPDSRKAIRLDFELDLEEQQSRAADASRRIADYQARVGAAFPLQTELDAKQNALALLDPDLAQTSAT